PRRASAFAHAAPHRQRADRGAGGRYGRGRRQLHRPPLPPRRGHARLRRPVPLSAEARERRAQDRRAARHPRCRGAGDARRGELHPVSVFVYAVRCNFAGGAAREAAWHEWYDGPKLRQMLELPLFLAVQRFAAAALDARRKYLALWQVASPDAFGTAEYRAQWGFAEWTQDITDWSRDLYRGPDDVGAILDIGADEALYLAVFDG